MIDNSGIITELKNRIRYDNLIELLKDVQELNISNPYLELLEAEILFKIGLFMETEKLLLKIILEENGDIVSEAKILLIYNYIRLGDINEVASVFDSFDIDSLSNNSILIKFYNLYAHYYSFIGNTTEQMNIFQKLNHIFEKLKHEYYFEYIEFLYNKADHYRSSSELVKSLNIVETSLDLLKINLDKYLLGKILLIKGHCYSQMGEYNRALLLFEEAEKLYTRISSRIGESAALGNIAGIYQLQGYHDKSIELYNKSLALDPYESRNAGFGYEGLGSIFSSYGEIAIALEYHHKAMRIREKINNPQELSFSFKEIGICHHLMGNYELSNEFLVKSLKINIDTNNIYHQAQILYHLVNTNIEYENIEKLNYYAALAENINAMNNDVIILYQLLTKAITLKSMKRPSKIFEAKLLLEEITNKYKSNKELYVISKFNICEILLYELELYPNDEIMDELSILTDETMILSEEISSQKLRVKIHILKSKLALLEFNFEEAMIQISKAEELVIDNNHERLAIFVLLQKELLLSQKIEWNEMKKQKASMSDRLEKSNISSFVSNLSMQNEGISMLVHDINNLVQLNQNYAGLLLLEESIPKDVREYITIIEKTSQNIKDLTTNLVSHNLPEILDINILELIVERIKILTSKAMDKKMSFITDFQRVDFFVNYTEMNRVVDNLIGNAIKFGPEHSDIIIRLYSENKYLVFEVQNDGPAIPKDFQSIIFNKYSRIHRDIPGSGLGLAICSQTLMLMNGRIVLESPLKGRKDGVLFRVFIPNQLP